MKLATTTGDYCAYYPKVEDTIPRIRLLHQAGFRYVDLSLYFFEPDSPFYNDGWEKHVDALANEAAKLGMTFVQAHSHDITITPGEVQDKQKEHFFRHLDICKKLGIPSTVIHASTKPEETPEQFVLRNKLFYSELLREAEKREVNVLTENTCHLNNCYYYLFTADDFFRLDEALGKHPLFGICWDIGHGHLHNVNQYDELTKLKDRLKAVHIHDNMRNNDTHAMPYLGTICFDEIMNGIIDNGFKGPFTMEADSSLRPESYIKQFGDNRVIKAPIELRNKMEEALYICGKYLLESYNLFEE